MDNLVEIIVEFPEPIKNIKRLISDELILVNELFVETSHDVSLFCIIE